MKNAKIIKQFNQKIGILGLGEENFALVKYLLSAGAKNITVCDQKEAGELAEYQRQLKDEPLSWRLGPAYLDNLADFEVIFRTPGLPYFNEKIQAAKKAGVEISSEIKFFFRHCPCPIIGVTGTKGKGTTSTLIVKILEAESKKKIFLAGNIGNAPIAFLDELSANDIVVLELSSFQLQDLAQSPHIAVVLDIKIDHLDYHQNRAEYVEAKTNIVKFQTKDDFAAICADYFTSVSLAAVSAGQIYWFSRRKSVDLGVFVRAGQEFILRTSKGDFPIAKTSEITLRGEHNWENIAAAATAGFLAGATPAAISRAVKDFKGLEHRLEFVREWQKIKFYNDSFSTTPDTAIAAINSFFEPIILIAGGSEKNADYSRLGKAIGQSTVKTAILIGATGPRIKKAITNPQIKIIDHCRNLDDVFAAVKTEAAAGNVVLLSPASASFGWFENYKDRGNQFKKLVSNLP